MSAPAPAPANALALSRPLLRGLVLLNLLYAAAIGLLFVAGLVAPDVVFDALGVRHGEQRAALVLGMRTVMVAGLVAAFVVDTVRAGDPFVAGNARRLQAIAWWVLAGEVLRLAIGATAWAASSPAQGLDLDTGFSLAPWLAVLLLFVLARVFAEGTRLRDDLAGTV